MSGAGPASLPGAAVTLAGGRSAAGTGGTWALKGVARPGVRERRWRR